MANHILLFFIILFSLNSHALIIQSVSGVSNYEVDSATSGVNHIYGGRAQGNSSSTYCEGDGVNTCDSCEGDGLHSCNPQSVYPSLNINFGFKSTTSYPAQVSIIFENDSRRESVSNVTFSQNTSQVSMTWGDLCDVMGATSCGSEVIGGSLKITIDKDNNGSADSGEETLTIKFTLNLIDDSSNLSAQTSCPTDSDSPVEGICYVSMYPGDQKLFIDEIKGSSNYSSGKVKLESVVFFQGETVDTTGADDANTLQSITNASTNHTVAFATNSSESSLSISSSQIDQLENGKRYCFVYGNQNFAKNIYFFAPSADFTSTPNSFCGTPSEVVGLLDEKKCFIATAAYGSAMDSRIGILRKFRDNFLVNNRIGQKFINFYYSNSPDWAAKIKESETKKRIVRILLWPIVFVVDQINQLNDFLSSKGKQNESI